MKRSHAVVGAGQQKLCFFWRGHGLVPPLFVVGMCLGAPAQAQLNSQVLRPFVGATAGYDSNVLGMASPEAALETTGTRLMSDTSRTAYAGVEIEKLIGRQLLSANLSTSHTAFNRLSQLDYRGENIAADWAWRVGNYWSGKAGFTRAVTLAPFTDFHGLESNTNTTERRYLSSVWRVHPDWQLHAEVARYGIDYSLLSQSRFDRNENQGLLGIDYTTRAGNIAGLQWRLLDGELPHQLVGPEALPNNYRQNQLELTTNWQVSGKTHVDFVGSVVSRAHKVAPERDFLGYNGRLKVGVAVSRNTAITVAAWRETGIFDDLSTAYSTNRGAQIGARWSATSKVTVEGSIKRDDRDFTRSLQFSSLPDYRDVLRTSQLTLTYLPLARLNIQVTVFDAAKSNSSGVGAYARHGASLSSRYQF